jgi:hypothetical protein
MEESEEASMARSVSDEALFTGQESAALLSNKMPPLLPSPWMFACAGMTERFVSAFMLSACAMVNSQ